MDPDAVSIHVEWIRSFLIDQLHSFSSTIKTVRSANPVILQYLQKNRPILFAPGLKGFQTHVLYALAVYSIDQRFDFENSSFASIRAYLLQFIPAIDFSSEDFKRATPMLHDRLACVIMNFYLKVRVEPAKICPDLIGCDLLSYESAFVRWMRVCVGASASFLTADFMWDMGCGQFVAVILSKVRPDLVRLTRVVFGNELTDADIVNNWRECEVALTVFGIPKPTPQQLGDQLCMLCFAADLYVMIAGMLPVAEARETFVPERKFETGFGTRAQPYVGPTNRMQRIDILLEKIDQLTRPLAHAPQPVRQQVVQPAVQQVYQEPRQPAYQQPTQLAFPGGYQQPVQSALQRPGLQVYQQAFPPPPQEQQARGQYEEPKLKGSPKAVRIPEAPVPERRNDNFETELKIIKRADKKQAAPRKSDSDDSLDEARELPQKILKSRILPNQQKSRRPMTRTEEERIFDKVHRLMTGQESDVEESLPKTKLMRPQSNDPHLLAKQRLLERAKKKREELKLAKQTQNKKTTKDDLIRRPIKEQLQESDDSSLSESPSASPKRPQRKKVVIDVDNDSPSSPTRTRIIDDGNSYLKIHLQRKKLLEGKIQQSEDKQVKFSISPSVGFDTKEDGNELLSEHEEEDLADEMGLSDTAERVKMTREKYKDLIPDFTESDFLLPPKNVLIPKPKVSPTKESPARRLSPQRQEQKKTESKKAPQRKPPAKSERQSPQKSSIPTQWKRPSPVRNQPEETSSDFYPRRRHRRPISDEYPSDYGYSYQSELDYSYSNSYTPLPEESDDVEPFIKPKPQPRRRQELKSPEASRVPVAKPFQAQKGATRQQPSELQSPEQTRQPVTQTGKKLQPLGIQQPERVTPVSPKKELVDLGTSPEASVNLEKKKQEPSHLAPQPKKVYADMATSPDVSREEKSAVVKKQDQKKAEADHLHLADTKSAISGVDSFLMHEKNVGDSLHDELTTTGKQSTSQKKMSSDDHNTSRISRHSTESPHRSTLSSSSKRHSRRDESDGKEKQRYQRPKFTGTQRINQMKERHEKMAKVDEAAEKISILSDSDSGSLGEDPMVKLSRKVDSDALVSVPLDVLKSELDSEDEPSMQPKQRPRKKPKVRPEVKEVGTQKGDSKSNSQYSDGYRNYGSYYSYSRRRSDYSYSPNRYSGKYSDEYHYSRQYSYSSDEETKQHPEEETRREKELSSIEDGKPIDEVSTIRVGNKQGDVSHLDGTLGLSTTKTATQKAESANMSDSEESIVGKKSFMSLQSEPPTDEFVTLEKEIMETEHVSDEQLGTTPPAKSSLEQHRSDEDSDPLVSDPSLHNETSDSSSVNIGAAEVLESDKDSDHEEPAEEQNVQSESSGIKLEISSDSSVKDVASDHTKGETHAPEKSSSVHDASRMKSGEPKETPRQHTTSDSFSFESTLGSEEKQGKTETVTGGLKSEMGASHLLSSEKKEKESELNTAPELELSITGTDNSQSVSALKSTVEKAETQPAVRNHTPSVSINASSLPKTDSRVRQQKAKEPSAKEPTSKSNGSSVEELDWSFGSEPKSDGSLPREELPPSNSKEQIDLGLSLSYTDASQSDEKIPLKLTPASQSIGDSTSKASQKDNSSTKEGSHKSPEHSLSDIELLSKSEASDMSDVVDISSAVEANEEATKDQSLPSDHSTGKSEKTKSDKDQETVESPDISIHEIVSSPKSDSDKEHSLLSDVIEMDSSIEKKEDEKEDKAPSLIGDDRTDSDKHESGKLEMSVKSNGSNEASQGISSLKIESSVKSESGKEDSVLSDVIEIASSNEIKEGSGNAAPQNGSSSPDLSIKSQGSGENSNDISLPDILSSPKSESNKEESVLSDVIDMGSLDINDEDMKQDQGASHIDEDKKEVASGDETHEGTKEKSMEQQNATGEDAKKSGDDEGHSDSEELLSDVWSGSDKDKSPQAENKTTSMNVSLISTTGTVDMRSPRSDADSPRMSQIKSSTYHTTSKRPNDNASSDTFSSPTEDTLDLGLSDGAEATKGTIKTATPKSQEEAKDDHNCFSTESAESLAEPDEIVAKSSSLSLSVSDEHDLPFESIESSNREDSIQTAKKTHDAKPPETSVTLSVEFPTLTLPKEDIMQLSAPLEEDQKEGSSPIESTVEIESALVDIHEQTISISDESDSDEDKPPKTEASVTASKAEDDELKSESKQLTHDDSFSLFNDDDVDSDSALSNPDERKDGSLLEKKELSSSEQEDLFNSVVTLPSDSFGSKKSQTGSEEKSPYALPSIAVSSNSCILGSNSEKSNLPSTISAAGKSPSARESYASKLLLSSPTLQLNDSTTAGPRDDSTISQSNESPSRRLATNPILAKTPPMNDDMVVVPIQKDKRRVSFVQQFASPQHRHSQVVQSGSFQKSQEDSELTKDYREASSKSEKFNKLTPQEERVLCCLLPVATEASHDELVSAVSKMLGVSQSDSSVGKIIQNITTFFKGGTDPPESESEAHEESSDSDMYF